MSMDFALFYEIPVPQPWGDRRGMAGRKPPGTYDYESAINDLDLTLLTFDYLQSSGACIAGGPRPRSRGRAPLRRGRL